MESQIYTGGYLSAMKLTLSLWFTCTIKFGILCLQLCTPVTVPTFPPAPQDSLLPASLFVPMHTSLLVPQIQHLLTLYMFVNFIDLLTYFEWLMLDLIDSEWCCLGCALCCFILKTQCYKISEVYFPNIHCLCPVCTWHRRHTNCTYHLSDCQLSVAGRFQLLQPSHGTPCECTIIPIFISLLSPSEDISFPQILPIYYYSAFLLLYSFLDSEI